jgi:hypothetical protein
MSAATPDTYQTAQTALALAQSTSNGTVSVYSSSTSNVSSNVTLVTDSNLLVNVKSGVYIIECLLNFYATANGAGGANVDLNGGSATINAISWAFSGYGTSITGVAANSSPTGNQILAAVAIDQNATSWMDITGLVTINAAGTFGPRWAQAVSSANALNRAANSVVVLTKIG